MLKGRELFIIFEVVNRAAWFRQHLDQVRVAELILHSTPVKTRSLI